MPRWLIASFIAFVLSCYGFAAAAQVRASEFEHVGDCQPAAVSIDDKASADGLQLQDAEDELAELDEAGSDFTEFLTGARPLLVPVVAAAWPPRHPPTTSPLPPLDRPKRPPRSHTFLV